MKATCGRRAATLVAIAALSGVFGALGVQPAGAAVTNPCKVVKRVEIQQAFGGTVASGRRGPSTPGAQRCEYAVSANGERPGGTVIVKVVTTDATKAFRALKESSQYAPIDGVPDALWAAKAHTVQILRDKVLVGVQGGFLVTDPLPLQFADDQAQLTGLAQLAADRA